MHRNIIRCKSRNEKWNKIFFPKMCYTITWLYTFWLEGNFCLQFSCTFTMRSHGVQAHAIAWVYFGLILEIFHYALLSSFIYFPLIAFLLILPFVSTFNTTFELLHFSPRTLDLMHFSSFFFFVHFLQFYHSHRSFPTNHNSHQVMPLFIETNNKYSNLTA